MRSFYLSAIIGMLCLGVGLVISCSSSGGDDNSARAGDDDDNSGEDDDVGDDTFDDTDDDDSDDDTADDDSADDTVDDDSADDDDLDDDDVDDDVSYDLIWQDPPSDEWMLWDDAVDYCENLTFDGHDDWRLPTISELRSLIRGCDATESDGSCEVTDGCTSWDCRNDPCDGCEYMEGPGDEGAYWPDGMSGEISWYWSSTPVEELPNNKWNVNFDRGSVSYSSRASNDAVRCVRE